MIEKGNVRFGSLAVVQHRISPMAAFGGKADIQINSNSPCLDVCFGLKAVVVKLVQFALIQTNRIEV